ncbi:LamG-like jellyroll fold domain-containing protein [Streptomyces mirabilis]|uniref:LamG-like jellyroll fold domain-containing protein n=1 Tax=Streptomyces mirabilis TaxID=68239 RepID=UPI00339FF81B
MASALAQAAATGKPVLIDAATTQTQQLTANPDGTVTFTNSLLPSRVERNGSWLPVDAALTANSDGTYSPAVTPSGLSLSGGGSGPLATMTDPAGHTVSYTLPFALPAPQVSGSTALYTSVLDGVDLSVRVSDQGGFADTLIVHNAAAAADPALKSLTLSTSTKGLSLGTDEAGDLQATTTAGTAYFTAPKPEMWDSSTTQGAVAAVQAHAAPAAASGTATTTPGDAGAVTTSTDAAPGSGAQVKAVGLDVSGDKLTLTPDQTMLTGAGTVYPVYIDPSINPTSTKASNHYDEIYSSSSCSGSPQYDTPQTAGEGAGYMQWGDGCGVGLERSLYAISLPTGIPTNATVIKSQLTAPDTYAASWDCSHSQPVYLHTVGGGDHATIYSSTDWNNKPAAQDSTYGVPSATVASGSNPSSSCSNKDAVFDTKGVLQKMINFSNTVWTVALYGDEYQSSSNDNFLRFSTGVSVTTTLDVPPNTPTNVHTTPQSANPTGPGCNNTGTGWIGAAGASGVTFSAGLSTDMSGENLAANFDIWDNSLNDGTGHSVVVNNKTVGWVASGGTETTSITPQDGHQYGWGVRTEDDTTLHLTSSWVTECHFSYDSTPPTTPAITASDPSFPQVGGGAANPVKYAGSGTQISVQVSATDSLPADTCTAGTCSASGINHFLWKLDGQPTTTDNGGSIAVSATGTDTSGAPTGSATIAAALPAWGVHTLYIAAVDKAGNLSQVPTSYTFYVPWNPSTKVLPGDLGGDGVPDLVATIKTGDLDMITGNAAPDTAPTLLSTAAQAPAGSSDSWSNYYLAHRGSAVGGAVDDLFAYNHGTGTGAGHMYVVINDLNAPSGTPGYPADKPGFTFGLHTDITNQPTCLITDTTRCGSSVGLPSDWSKVTGLTGVGDLVGNGSSDYVLVSQTKPGTTARQLWLYQAVSGPALINPILLGDGDWTGFTLTVGTVGATNTGGVWGGGTPTLIARDNLTGSLYSFPLTLNVTEPRTDSTSESIPTLLHAPVHTTLQSALVPSSGHLCVDDDGKSTTNGTKIQVWACNGSAAQVWTAAADNSLRVLGKCLDVTSGGTTNGTLVQLYTCNNTGSQKWTTGPNGSLVNPQSGKCLDDPNGSTTNGTQLQIYTCNNSASQNWTSSASAGWNTTPATALAPVLPASAYPTFASPGDVNSSGTGPDGNTDLYVTDTGGQLIEYPGAAPSGTTPAFGSPLSLGTITDTAADAWPLSDGSGTTAADSAGSLNATLHGAAAWTNDVSTGSNRGTIMNLNGTTGYAATSGPAVNTSQSFTVSAWVYLNALSTTTNSTFVSQSDAGETAANGFQLYYSSGAQVWAFDRHNDDTTSTSFTAAYGQKAVAGQWTHLVGVYDADSGLMSLYVNGHLSATKTYTGTVWNASGPIEIGRRLYQGSYGEYANAEISDVRTYNTALPPADAAANNDNSTTTNLN